MAKVHYCRFKINLAGQGCHVIVYDEHNPLSWPEVQVLMRLHDEENVTEVVPVRLGDVVPAREKDRLISLYGYKTVEAVFPGRQFRMNLMMTDDEQLPHIDEPPGATDVDDETIAQLAAAAPVFKPGRNARPVSPPKE